MNIPALDDFLNQKHQLLATGTWKKSVHVFERHTAQAIRAAMAAGRPLLVRGEPGTGKSQLARAAATVMGRKFLSQVIDAHTEIQDLWYRFDAVSRLGHAQVLGLSHKPRSDNPSSDNPMSDHQVACQSIDIAQELDPSNYLSPGILWWAFSWETAEQHPCDNRLFQPDPNDAGDADKGVVLLLDEIDKADADLPNSLLETLDNGKFNIPWLQKSVGISADDPRRPLVIITTNEDRQLPGAFLRRCMVLDLQLPKKASALQRYLKKRAALHFPQHEDDSLDGKCRFDDEVLNMAAEQLYQDRQHAEQLGLSLPGQAEYLDMLRVLDRLANDDVKQQLAMLETIKDFALKKHQGMQNHEQDDGEQRLG